MYRQTHELNAPGDVRLTHDDVRAVIDVWIDHQWGNDRATVSDVAEGLDITAEDVHALLEEVYARRARVEIDVLEERERLELELRELTAEQARLTKTERRLTDYAQEWSKLHELRLHTRRRNATIGSSSITQSAKSGLAAQERRVTSPGPRVIPRRRSAADTAAAVTILLLVGGLTTAVVWDACSGLFHALLR